MYKHVLLYERETDEYRDRMTDLHRQAGRQADR